MPPDVVGVVDGETQMDVARIGGRLGVRNLARLLVVEQLERIAARQVDEGGADRDAGIADDDGRDRAGRAPCASAPARRETPSQKASAASRSATLMPM